MSVNIEGALRKILIDDATVAGLIGQRVYHQDLPPGVDYPCVSFERIGGSVIGNITGALSGLSQATYQFHIWANKRPQLKSIRHGLFRLLPGARRTVSVDSVNVVIQGIDHDEPVDYEVPEVEPQLFHYVIDFNVWYEESFT